MSASATAPLHGPLGPPVPDPVPPALELALLHQIVREVRVQPDVGSLLCAVIDHLRAAGIRISRCWAASVVLHPQAAASSWVWSDDACGMTVTQVDRQRLAFMRAIPSPLQLLVAGMARYRFRHDPTVSCEFGLVRDLFAAGHTDYFALPVHFAGQVGGMVAWTTKAEGGFSASELALLQSAHPILQLAIDTHVQANIGATLLRTYLGTDAGDRVRAGQVQRGDGQTVPAALWMSDLRGFTALSERLERDAVLSLINDAFDELVAAVHGAGGQVLKFIGDGMLATFSAEGDETARRAACAAALKAARVAHERVDVLNLKRTAEGLEPVRFGLGLHVGDVLYGNIGGQDRLDFTVIGPAVNRVARIEGLCSQLGRGILVSAEFAALCGEPMVALGRFPLKGVAAAEEVFGLA